MRVLPAVLLALHGLAHLPGFLTPWRLATLEGLPYTTRVLAGRVDVGAGGARMLGVLWLLTALAFWLAADLAVLGRGGWGTLALAACAVSFVLCVLGLPEARLGLALNAAMLAALLLMGPRAGWL